MPLLYLAHLMALTFHFSNQILYHPRQLIDHLLRALTTSITFLRGIFRFHNLRFLVINLLNCRLLFLIFCLILIFEHLFKFEYARVEIGLEGADFLYYDVNLLAMLLIWPPFSLLYHLFNRLYLLRQALILQSDGLSHLSHRLDLFFHLLMVSALHQHLLNNGLQL